MNDITAPVSLGDVFNYLVLKNYKEVIHKRY